MPTLLLGNLKFSKENSLLFTVTTNDQNKRHRARSLVPQARFPTATSASLMCDTLTQSVTTNMMILLEPLRLLITLQCSLAHHEFVLYSYDDRLIVRRRHPSSVPRFVPQHTWTSRQYDQIHHLAAQGAACAELLHLGQWAMASW
jgi:hypothetical protein